MIDERTVEIIASDRATGVDRRPPVPSPPLVPAPFASKLVMVPVLSRTNP